MFESPINSSAQSTNSVDGSGPSQPSGSPVLSSSPLDNHASDNPTHPSDNPTNEVEVVSEKSDDHGKRRISSITVDNCSTNDAMIDLLWDKLDSTSLMLGGDLFHMRCCAHILNLVVKDGLDVIKVIREITKRMVEKFDEYWSVVHGVVEASAVLDPRTIDTAKLELDHYLSETVLPKSAGFDVLNCLKSHQPKYPILQAMARDLLAILISTIASESAFSTSGRLVSPHRSRLHPDTMEALMCAHSWLWAAEMKGESISEYELSKWKLAFQDGNQN
ncbi:hypothetical protein RHSIM_Rhsim05G0141200 [Rhododendron simsii]|uniref:HAT C-terminal dimerisation domain-containing protein n=1 Tax=Rhododendron simsii TaxID=118357 RepID=A0A834H6B7_RHOSS|nr:hypothetical protein RHSIM_Rhsim05G0141200 [Rhododendron simsii]